MPATFNDKKKYRFSLFLSTIIICIPAFINNFPFIYSDTGTYLEVGFSNSVSYIRPIAYGIFMRHISLHQSLWLVVAAQAFIISWLILFFAKTFFKNTSPFSVVLAVFILTATTSIGVSTGMLMPDFATPILILATALLLFSEIKSKWSLFFICLALWFTVAAHHSHGYILLLILLSLGFKWLFFRQTLRFQTNKRFLLVVFLLIFGYFTIPYLNYSRNGKFIGSKSSNIFLMNRINQMGLLEPFLDQQCPTGHYPICEYKDNIPRSFLWGSNTPVRKDGGWDANNDLYQEIIIDFIKTPQYLEKFIIKSLETGVQQFFSFKTVNMVSLYSGKWPQMIFEKYMPDVVPALEKSMVNKGVWNTAYLNFTQHVLVFFSALLLLYLFFYQKKYPIEPVHRNLAFLLLMGLLSNAFICGGVSMIAPRFQARIIWVLPLFTMYLCYDLWGNQNARVKMPS